MNPKSISFVLVLFACQAVLGVWIDSSAFYNYFKRPVEFENQYLRAPYKPCSDNRNGILRKVEVIPCESEERCPLVKGTNITLDVEFVSNVPASKLIGSLAGKLNSYITLPFGQPEDLCSTNQIKCPIVPGQVYHYQTTVFVKQSYPRLSLDTKVLIEGDNKEIACALIPVIIVSPPKSSQ